MRQVHLNQYERVAGLFILIAIGGSLLGAASVAIKQGWFEPKIKYSTTFENADGVHAGTTVKMAGLNAGSVDDVELLADNKVKVSFHILGKFSDRLRDDSVAQLIRPFIIGDRVLEITVGSESRPALPELASLRSAATVDLMTLMSGKKMGQALAEAGKITDSLQTLLHAFSDKQRIDSVVRMFDHIEPLLMNLNAMSFEVTKLSRQANKDDQLGKVLSQVVILTREVNAILPELNRQNPELAKDLALMTHSLGKVTREMDRALAEIGPDMPGTAKRAVEALNEATILMKAMQKSFFIRSSVREVKDEEAKDPARLPASKKPDVGD